ncbi:MAG: hypothetical protein DWQ35_21940 [Planctomycetota bacterium]|nr:MAG: hypothetical protein DWQ35_21940 [Planctomycetota bacterium]
MNAQNPGTYKQFAEDYYEADVPLDAVSAIYRHELITTDIVSRLNASAEGESIRQSSEKMGYGKAYPFLTE